MHLSMQKHPVLTLPLHISNIRTNDLAVITILLSCDIKMYFFFLFSFKSFILFYITGVIFFLFLYK